MEKSGRNIFMFSPVMKNITRCLLYGNKGELLCHGSIKSQQDNKSPHTYLFSSCFKQLRFMLRIEWFIRLEKRATGKFKY